MATNFTPRTPAPPQPQEVRIPNNQPTETSDNVQLQQQQQQQPHFSSTVTELRNLSASLSTFLRRYDELQSHLDFIRSATDSQLPQLHLNPRPSPSPNSEQRMDNSQSRMSQHLDFHPSVPPTRPSPPIVSVSETLTTTAEPVKSEQTADNSHPRMSQHLNPHHSPPPPRPSPPIVPVSETLTTTAGLAKTEKTTDNSHSRMSAIESICKSMSSHRLHKYIVSRLSEAAKLREEFPAALKLAPNPAKLVLECLSFPERRAFVLILEIFLMMGCGGDEIEAAVKEEAELAAVEWRNRMVNEGGVAKSSKIDAQVLLLLIGCFGIPSAFKNGDVRDLIWASNASEISDSLCRSHDLLTRISEIVAEMMENRIVVKAVDIAYTFGLEGRFHPRACLQHFLQESRETLDRERIAAHSDEAMNEANKKHFADLKSVLKCLEAHKIDPFIGGWQLHKKMSNLGKEIALLDKKIADKVTQKREADEPESSKNLTNQEVKRPRLVSPHAPQLQKATAYVDGRSSSDGLIPTNLVNGGIHGLPTGAYAGVQGGMPVDSAGQVINNGQPYGWHGNAPFRERLIGHGYAEPAPLGLDGLYRPAPSMVSCMGGLVDSVGQVTNSSGPPYGWHGDAPFRERLISRAYTELAPLGVNDMFRPAPSMEGFAGMPNLSPVGVSNRSSASDLYGFADSVM